MNKRIRELIKEAGGELWQRIESDGVLNKEAYITFDPPQSLEKFAELIVRDCASICEINGQSYKHSFTPAKARLAESTSNHCGLMIKKHFGVEQ